MSGLRIPRFVRLSASTAGTYSCDFSVRDGRSPRTCVLRIGPAGEFASSGDNSPSLGLPWYVSSVRLVIDSHQQLCTNSLLKLFASRGTLLVSCGSLRTVTGVRRHNGRVLYHP